MKYLKVFETEALQNEFRSSQDYIEPHVSCLINGKNVKYNKSLEQLKVPFTIEAAQDGTKVYFRQSSYAADGGLDPLKVEVSTDNGETWEEITAAPAEDDVPGATLAELDEGDKVLIRGKNEAYGFYIASEDSNLENCNFYADKPCYVYGNIMSLVGGDDFARLRKVKEYSFTNFFSDYDGDLDSSWVLSKEGEELLLPATMLAMSCYESMFTSCTGLTTAPELPATTLSDSCYICMFQGCTGLTTAPELPATTLASDCYNYMFNGCSNLSYIKAMFTTTPGSLYTSNWVKNVKSTGTFVKNSAATWDVTGDNGVPTGWTVETASPSNQEFVAIAVSSGNDYVIYIKSTELSDFVSMNTGVHVYSNEACTTQANDGYYAFTDSGLTAYYASEGNEFGESPGCDEFEVSNGIINRYIIPE